METNSAIAMLSALGHDGRLAIFRLLVKAGAAGVAAGEIARVLGVRPNSLSSNLALLSHAGLVQSRRDGRSIIYTADYGAISRMIGFLIEDCCSGTPEVCAPLEDVLSRVAACAPRCAPGC